MTGQVTRGEIYAHATVDRRYLIVSADGLSATGTVIVAEVADQAPDGTRGMLAVTLGASDSVPGAVLAWRVNYVAAERLGKHLGRLSETTMEVVDMALRTAFDL